MIQLKLEKLSKTFGGLQAINNMSFEIPPRIIKALIGPNGAGKTTTFSLISGLERPTLGRIFFQGRDITRYPPHYRSSLGIARTFQNLHVFTNMSVLENVMTGRHLRTKANLLHTGLRTSLARREEKEARKDSLEILEFMGLANKANMQATSLPYGEQRLLEIARALATEPTLLLLDEPAAGLNESETERLAEKICWIRDQGVTVLLVEHNMRLVMGISQEVVVLNYGVIIAEGSAEEIQSDPLVIKAYLGEKIEDA